MIFTVFLLIPSFVTVIAGQTNQVMKIKGVIAGYEYGSFMLVRTAKNQYAFIYMRTPPMSPIPEAELQKTREWIFAVKPVGDCDISFSFLRFQMPIPLCGNDYNPQELPQPQQTPAIVAIQYPQLRSVSEKYRKEMDAISDETKLLCYELDLNNTKPTYRQRTAAGVVVAEDGTPIPKFAVSIGFADKKLGYIGYVETDQLGRFAIPVFENFSYWIKLGVTFMQGQRQYKETLIPKKVAIPPLTLKLEYE